MKYIVENFENEIRTIYSKVNGFIASGNTYYDLGQILLEHNQNLSVSPTFKIIVNPNKKRLVKHGEDSCFAIMYKKDGIAHVLLPKNTHCVVRVKHRNKYKGIDYITCNISAHVLYERDGAISQEVFDLGHCWGQEIIVKKT